MGKEKEGLQKRTFNGSSTCEQVLAGRDLKGTVIAITGTTSGIGTETACQLALAGAHVVTLNRSRTLSTKQREDILSKKPDAQMTLIECDLSSLASVREAANQLIHLHIPLHALILNAGVFACPQKATVDGLEMTFGVNHVGHFYLVKQLLPLLRETKTARVVIVSSEGHGHSGLSASKSTEDKLCALIPPADTPTMAFPLYCLSKLCNVLFAKRLHQLEHDNGIDVYVLHPGAFISTGLARGYGFWGNLMNAVTSPFTKSLSQGAATSVYLATHPEVAGISGRYWDSCWDDEKKLKKALTEDKDLQEGLWNKTEEIISNFEAQHPN